MIAQTDISDKRVRKVFWAPKTLPAHMLNIGIMADIARLKLASASWKMSFKFVSNAVSSVGRGVDVGLNLPSVKRKLNIVTSMTKASKTGCINCFNFALLQWSIPAAPKYIVVNPMITESA